MRRVETEAQNKAVPRLQGLNVLGTPGSESETNLGSKPPHSHNLITLHLVFSTNEMKVELCLCHTLAVQVQLAGAGGALGTCGRPCQRLAGIITAPPSAAFLTYHPTAFCICLVA